MLSTPERSASSALLRTAYRLSVHHLLMEIAQRIRAARNDLGLSQRQVAAKLKVSPSAVAQWELGDTLPKMGNRADLARLLHIPFIDLLPEAGEIGELTVKDPVILAIVQRLLELPQPVREAYLMQAEATVESLQAMGTARRPRSIAGKPTD